MVMEFALCGRIYMTMPANHVYMPAVPCTVMGCDMCRTCEELYCRTRTDLRAHDGCR